MNNNPTEILVYTEKRTNRLRYTLDEVFARRLGFKVIQTTRTKDFIGYDGIKLNYSIKSLEGGYQIRPNGLLAGKSLQPVEFEKGAIRSTMSVFGKRCRKTGRCTRHMLLFFSTLSRVPSI